MGDFDLLTGSLDDTPLISLHVITASPNPVTMQVKGEVGKRKQVHILIDGGATHNFIHPSLTKFVKGVISNELPLNVLVASGERMTTTELIHNLLVDIQGHRIAADFYILPVFGCKMVLGTAWLQILGDIVWNFEKRTMKFILEEHNTSCRDFFLIRWSW